MEFLSYKSNKKSAVDMEVYRSMKQICIVQCKWYASYTVITSI